MADTLGTGTLTLTTTVTLPIGAMDYGFYQIAHYCNSRGANGQADRSANGISDTDIRL